MSLSTFLIGSKRSTFVGLSLLALISLIAVPLYSASPSLVSQLPEQENPGLRRLLALALENSQSMKSSRLLEEERDGERLTARSRQLPNINLLWELRHEDRIDESGTDFEDREILGFVIRQPLYHWNALNNNTEISKRNLEIAQLGTQQSFATLALNIRSTFLRLSLSKRSLQSLRARIALDTRNRDAAQQRFEQGSGSQIEVGQLNISLAHSDINLRRQENAYERDINDFAIQVGVAVEKVEGLIPSEIAEFEPLSEAELVSLKGRLELFDVSNARLEILNKGVEVQERRYHIARRSLHPKINVTSGLTQNQRDVANQGFEEEEYFYMGLAVNWNLFDGFGRSGRQRSALSKLNQAELALDQYQAQLRNNLRFALNDLILARKSLQLEMNLFDADEAALIGRRELFELEKISEVELRRTEQRFLDRSTGLQRARGDYLNTLSAFVSALGMDPYVERLAYAE